MKKGFVLFLACCVLFQSTAFTAAWAASPVDQKESIVLLPVRGQGMTENELSFYRDAVAQGLSSNYKVKYGDQVDKVIHDVFTEESKSGLECDESRCYRDIATMLNVKLIAKATIIPRGGDYQISMVIYNVYENSSVMTKVDVCKKCESDQLLKMLVALAGADAGKMGMPSATERSAATDRMAAAERERTAAAEAKAAAERERIAAAEGKAAAEREAAVERKAAAERKATAERERKAAAGREQAAAAERTAAAEGNGKDVQKEEGTKWYWYALGALAVGGIAAAAGGGGGGGGGGNTGTTTNTGGNTVPVTLHW